MKDDPESLNTEFGFRVDFVRYPPDLSFIYQPDEYASDDTSSESEAEHRSASRKIVMGGEHRGGVFIEIRVPIGGNKYETLMCMGGIEKPNDSSSSSSSSSNVHTNRPGKITEILQHGKAAGGRPRRACTGPRRALEGPLEAEYDEVDELLRRLQIASAQAERLLDKELIDSVVEQYLEDTLDSTPGLYS